MFKKMLLLLALLAISLLSQNSVFAQSGTATFSLPVTSDQQSYRKFDSKARAGKFHTGDDYYNSDLMAKATSCGVVVKIITLGHMDHGLGNTVIIKHTLTDGQVVYSLYAHLASFDRFIKENRAIGKGSKVGTIGQTGSGSGKITHLHFEIKSSNTLANPLKFGSIQAGTQYGYVPIKAGTNKTATSATDYGYFKPTPFYSNKTAMCQ